MRQLGNREGDNVCAVATVVPIGLGWNQPLEFPEHNRVRNDAFEIFVIELKGSVLPLCHYELAVDIKIFLGTFADFMGQLKPRVLDLR